MPGRAFVTGKSARLKRVVTSSTGAEVYALSAAARGMVAVRNQLRELQHPIEQTSTLRGDNQSSLLVATTPGKHRSSLRHLGNCTPSKSKISSTTARSTWSGAPATTASPTCTPRR